MKPTGKRIQAGRPVGLLAAVFLLLAAAGLRPAAPALASCGGTTVVTTETELNDAIDDFNGQAGPCDYEIEFGADITQTDHLTVINNTNAGVSLLVDGAGFTQDGDSSFETFRIDNTDQVTFSDITIIDSGDDGIEANTSDVRTERVTILGASSDAVELYAGELVVVDSTLASSFDDGIDAYDGTPTIYVINSTIAGNLDDGLYQYDATSTLTHVTLVGNGVGLYMEFGSATINNSILADNEANCLAFDGGAADINFSLLDSTDDACGATDGVDDNIVGEDPRLLPLGDYGGPTPTTPPFELTGGVTSVSPAIDEGSNALSVDETATTLDFDQRGAGFPRELNSIVDMGAVEGAEAFACLTFPVTVVDEAELVAAILCYNGITTTGVYTVELDADIDLTASLPVIDNNEAGVSLVIEGNSNTIDGQNTPGVRPITVAQDTTVTLISALITGGNVGGNGGGILNEGDLTLEGVNVDENTADNDGGGIFNEDDATLTLNNSTVNSNLASYPDGDGGGISNDGLAFLTDTAVSANTVEGNGGVWAGGIWNEGVMTIVRGVIANNNVDADEGGAFGGGIANQANLIIRDSAITGNSATTVFEALGGGVHSEADEEEVVDEGYGAQLLIINSTISNNVALADETVFGGGLYATDGCCLDDPVPVTLINTTLAGNFVSASQDLDFGGGGAYFELSEIGNSLEVTIHNSILANSMTDGAAGEDCVLGDDVDFESLHSLYEDTDDGACGLAAANPDADGNIVGVDPALGSLGNNGGPTLSHLPDDSSEAVNAGDNDLADDENGDPLAADQRGFVPRVFDGTVDMGSVEVGAESPDSGGVFMSATVPGVTDDAVAFGSEDILRNDDGDWSIWFDGSAAGLTPLGKFKHNINAFWFPTSGGDDVVMSFTQNARIVPGIIPKVDGMDLVWWDGSAFTLWFDGSDVGLTNKTQEKIDSLHVLPGSESPIGGACLHYLLVSTQGPGRVPTGFGGAQLRFGGEDVLGFCMTNAGSSTAGFWHMALDGSAEGMPVNSTDSISFSDDGQTMYLTTRGTFNVDAASGGHSMVYRYDFGTGDFDGPFFVAADEGLAQKVDGLQVEGILP